MKKMNIGRITVLFAALVLAFPAYGMADQGPVFNGVAGPGPDELWEDTTTGKDPNGKPWQQTNLNCVKKSANNNVNMKREFEKNLADGCKMDYYRQSGNPASGIKVSFKSTCNGKDNKGTSTGEYLLKRDSHTTKMHAVGTYSGQRVDMEMTVTGKKIGSCTYAKQGQDNYYSEMQKESRADMANDGQEEEPTSREPESPKTKQSNAEQGGEALKGLLGF